MVRLFKKVSKSRYTRYSWNGMNWVEKVGTALVYFKKKEMAVTTLRRAFLVKKNMFIVCERTIRFFPYNYSWL